MSCYHPIKAFSTPSGVVFSELRRHDITGRIDIACGQCIGCRMRRASDWALRVMHEAACYDENCFITLTYGNGNLPENSSLEHRDFQLFLKRVRKLYAPREVRFFMCGEYGPLKARPHYHACLFNVDFQSDRVLHCKSSSGYDVFTSATLSKLWPLGIATVQDLCRETASYCARYIMDKALGDAAQIKYTNITEDGEIIQRKPEYCAMSLKPGVGARWFKKFHGDVYNGDYVIHDGKKQTVPRFYDKLLKRNFEGVYDVDELMYNREMRARAVADDNTDERLATKERVHLARVSTLVRGDLDA